jgi:hypothetical protein
MDQIGKVAIFLLVGLAAGSIHFALLRHNVNLIIAGRSALVAVLVTVGRLALTVAVFALAAIFFGVAVLWMLAGFVAARFAAVRIVRAEA